MKNEEFYKELEKINIKLTNNQKEQLETYYEYLIEYNTHTNVTAITDKEDVYLKHFYDSITLSITTDFHKINNMLDIGCGAGFPGLVIKIVFPHIKLTLLDSNNKKTTFCKNLVEKIKLDNVEIINERAEEFIKNKREFYDLVTARAVKNLAVLNELAIPYVKINGLFIAMKSNVDNELKESLKGIDILGGKYLETINLELPNNAGLRNFIIIKKIKETNTKFPRQYNQIIKKPL